MSYRLSTITKCCFRLGTRALSPREGKCCVRLGPPLSAWLEFLSWVSRACCPLSGVEPFSSCSSFPSQGALIYVLYFFPISGSSSHIPFLLCSACGFSQTGLAWRWFNDLSGNLDIKVRRNYFSGGEAKRPFSAESKQTPSLCLLSPHVSFPSAKNLPLQPLSPETTQVLYWTWHATCWLCDDLSPTELESSPSHRGNCLAFFLLM